MKTLLLLFSSAILLAQPYNGTLVGSPTFAAGKFSNGISTSSGNYMTIPSGAVAPLNTNNWTVSLWLKASAPGALKIFFSSNAGAPIAVWAGVSASNTITVSCDMNLSPTYSWDSGVAVTGANQHVEFSVDSGTTLRLFVDGTLTNTVTGTYISPVTTGGAIGILYGASPTYDITAVVDDVLIRTGVAHTTSFTPPTAQYANNITNGVALYHLEDATDSWSASSALSISSLSSGTITSSSIVLNATVSGGTSPYSTQYQQSPAGCGSFSNIGSPVAGATPSYNATGLTASTTYCFRATVTDSVSATATSSNFSASTTAPVYYTRVDDTAPRGGQAIMILLPGGVSANPYNSANPTTLVIYHHGAGEDQTGLISDSLKNGTGGITNTMLDAGYILVGTNAHGDNWGTQQAVDDYVDLYKYCITNYNIGKVLALGQSMGGLTAALSLASGKIPYVGAALIYPALSLSNIYGLGVYTAAINTAHGITGTGTNTYAYRTVGQDPILYSPISFRHRRVRSYASASDTTVPMANNTTPFINGLAGTAVEASVYTATGGHGDPSHFQPTDLMSFFGRALADVVKDTGRLAGTVIY